MRLLYYLPNSLYLTEFPYIRFPRSDVLLRQVWYIELYQPYWVRLLRLGNRSCNSDYQFYLELLAKIFDVTSALDWYSRRAIV
jgi:hypothetical protein